MDVTIIMVMLNNKQEVIMFSNPTNILFPPQILHTRKLSTIQPLMATLQDFITGNTHGPRRHSPQ